MAQVKGADKKKNPKERSRAEVARKLKKSLKDTKHKDEQIGLTAKNRFRIEVAQAQRDAERESKGLPREKRRDEMPKDTRSFEERDKQNKENIHKFASEVAAIIVRNRKKKETKKKTKKQTLLTD